MNINTKTSISHSTPLILAFLLTVMLVSSVFTCIFMNNSNGASLTNAVHVKNETELKNAINNASSKTVTVTLDNDITLTEPLTILANKDITLTSNKVSGYYRLNGAEGMSTIAVEGGMLKLDVGLTKEAF